MRVSPLLTAIVLLFVVILSGSVRADNGYTSHSIPENFELDVKLRMRKMECIVAPRLNDEVRFYLGKYIFKHPAFTAKMLGNAALYFPIFDKLLKEKGLPSELKALSILESWLDPAATSRVGAGGLWQLMPQTARLYGLEVSKNIDERRDLYKSTEAALTLLKNLYTIYGDWGLTLAAYNVGPVRVNQAIKRAGVEKPQFWSIAPYLPKETQHFVPKFIAFSYLIQFYADHEIYPQFPDLDLQIVDVMKVYQKMSLDEVAQVTNIHIDLLKKLNPAYRNGIIPKNTHGHNLVLPKRVLNQFNEYLNLADKEQKKQYLGNLEVNATSDSNNAVYVESTYIVEEGDDLDFIAFRFDINKLRIMLWNHLSSEYLVPGQKLKLFVPLETYKEKFVLESGPMECVGPISPDNLLKTEVRNIGDLPLEDNHGLPNCTTDILYHQVKHGETWLDIALQHPYAKLQDIRNLNQGASLVPGRQIVIPAIDHVDSKPASTVLLSRR
jgi:membrane-bound lytic murein transglycosylase D